MKSRLIFISLLCVIAFGWLALPVAAQGNNPLVAYENASRQLVITNADGSYRWIVTNPGEQLAPTVNVAWSPDGSQLLFGVQSTTGISLRVADPASQTVRQLTDANGSVDGGEWAGNNAIVAGTLGGVVRWDGSSPDAAVVVAPNGQIVSNQAVSPQGDIVFYQQGDQLAYAPVNGGAETLLGRSTANASGIGLWADTGSVIAYPTLTGTGTTALSVTNARTGETLTLDSGSSAPLQPLAWVDGSLTLIYRGANDVLALNAACITSGCNPVPVPTPVLPASTTALDIAGNNLVIYAADGSLLAANATCLNNGSCASSAVNAGSIAAGTPLLAAGTIAAYTAGDASVSLVDLTCANSGTCTAVSTGARGRVAGISGNGAFVLVNTGNEFRVYSSANPAASALLGNTYSDSRAAWNNR